MAGALDAGSLMGLGDQLLATGFAKGAAARGKRIAFGDGHRIIWDHNSGQIFERNPNIVPPGSEGGKNQEWINYYKGSRIYNRQGNDRWIWNYQFEAKPGEMYFSEQEIVRGARYGKDFILIEPNIEGWKPSAPNKQWGADKWRALTEMLLKDFQVAQFRYPKSEDMLPGVKIIETKTFREALAVMRNASIYVGAEGGLHHGAAALERKAVVIFGGWVPPEVTGYKTHTNLASGGPACGSFKPCHHCKRAMDDISLELVYDSVVGQLR